MNRRVDFLIDVLLKIEKDDFFNYMHKIHMNDINYKEIKEAKRHEKGMKIPSESIKVYYYMYIMFEYLLHVFYYYVHRNCTIHVQLFVMITCITYMYFMSLIRRLPRTLGMLQVLLVIGFM